MIEDARVQEMPHFGGTGCRAVGVTPVDMQLGLRTVVPPDFFARPGQTRN